jgi:hypothetical protein
VERVTVRLIGAAPTAACWHCGQTLGLDDGLHAARYMYRGEQPFTAIVEDWIECACGAYQNLRSLNEIIVEPLGNT